MNIACPATTSQLSMPLIQLTGVYIMFIGPSDNCINGEIRLVSGRSDIEGTVQVCVFGYWGTICDTSWDSRDAYVVCKRLGYPAIGK